MKTTSKHYSFWTKIRDFQIDDTSAAFRFSDKLAKEQGWSKEYTDRVIDEYKKFIFLICVTGQSCTPSEDVDQAWHMHLVYTKSYWIDFCRNTIGREIHHTPSKGGSKETDNFKFQYEETKRLYENYFEEETPKDIWPDTESRFQFYFRRIDLREYVLIPKPRIPKFARLGAFLSFGFLNSHCSGTGNGFGGFLLSISIVIGFIHLLGLIFTDSEDEKNVRRRELNREAHNVHDLAQGESFSDGGIAGCGGDAGGCGGGCGGCGGCG
ncbi:MAG TPA: hypothetical protein PK079_04685 [Leptospiraceae bacterium]|nr:hypothetical protein [Leptospiraceae bacterium]HMW04954.1 hypothetical protein [Leptospiraceae bacterium]HMX31897.1 hypothetical protein [Leptospiraceae bacterium]HMY30825.1 hypothetical protein [Leptospiraceae bacterium]HMZ64286.1 hypothetical protein [Leptospiraceae bacterium]